MSDPLNTRQVAERLGVAPVSVRRWISEKRLRALRVGRDYLIDPADLARFERPEIGRPSNARLRAREQPAA